MAAATTYFVFRIGLGGICLLAGLEKARAPREFFAGVRRYRDAPAFQVDRTALDKHKLLAHHITG